MNKGVSYTTEEISQILRVSKLTVYDLIKRGELPAYRVGRQMRVDSEDLEAYKVRSKGEQKSAKHISSQTTAIYSHQQQDVTWPTIPSANRSVIISGQDISLDLLANHLEKRGSGFRTLRSHQGSLNSLISMYQGESDIVSTHLLDADSGEFNIPYIRKILVGQSYLVVNMMSRWAGFYVQTGNPKALTGWKDLSRTDITLVNRERGSGARILLDEQLRMHGISKWGRKGYEQEETSHLGVASVIASGQADVGVGIEKAARMVGIDFVPLIKESYDLVLLKTSRNQQIIEVVMEILRSQAFQNEISSLGGYDISRTGSILYETE